MYKHILPQINTANAPVSVGQAKRKVVQAFRIAMSVSFQGGQQSPRIQHTKNHGWENRTSFANTAVIFLGIWYLLVKLGQIFWQNPR